MTLYNWIKIVKIEIISRPWVIVLFDILSEIVKHDDVLLIVRNHAAVGEIKSNSLSIKQKEKWVTIGENDGPAHMHIDSELIKSCEF